MYIRSFAASIGGLVAVQMLDITGIFAASGVAVMSLFVIPWRKSVVR